MTMILVNMVIFGPCTDCVNLVYTLHTFTARSTVLIHSHLLLGNLHSLWNFYQPKFVFFFSPRECYVSHPAHLFLDLITLTF